MNYSKWIEEKEEEAIQKILKHIDEMNVNNYAVANAIKVSENKYPFAIMLNFDSRHAFHHHGATLISGLDEDTANKFEKIINDHIQKK